MFVLVSLNACQLKMPFMNEKVTVDDLNYENIDQQNKAISNAVNLLENGEKTRAEKLIRQVLRFNPNHEIAVILDRQLNTSAAKIFSTVRTTTYQVKQGDTLGSISKEWLENPIYFVTLAKLNNLENPSQIKPGMRLIIPVTESSPLVKQERRRSRANIELLSQYLSQKETIKTLTRMTSIFIIKSHQQELLQLQHDALNRLAASSASISERHRMIDQVKVISAKSGRKILEPNFQQFIKLQLHNVLLNEFLLLFEDKSYFQAASKIIEAKKLKPIIKQNIQILETEKKLVNKLHEKAIVLRKNQQLKEAMESWHLILELQPENSLAAKYYQRTKKLLSRLDELQ